MLVIVEIFLFHDMMFVFMQNCIGERCTFSVLVGELDLQYFKADSIIYIQYLFYSQCTSVLLLKLKVVLVGKVLYIDK